jgi:hypothetical protein
MVDVNTIQMEIARKAVLFDEFQKPYFSAIREKLAQEKAE